MKAKVIKNIISTIFGFAIIGGATYWIITKFVHFGDVEFTDNAQVQQQIVPVNSRVQGYIKEIRFSEYEKVHKGDTLIIIDDSDLRLNFIKAKAELSNALAGKETTGQTINAASADVLVSEATIEEAKVRMEMAEKDFARYDTLYQQEAATRQEMERARTEFEALRARYEMLKKQSEAVSTTVDLTRSRIPSSEANINLAKAMVETAKLNLSYTVITAPCDGYTSRKDIQVGQLVQPGQTLLDIVDTSDVWITANYKETQLKHIHPGSEVEIIVDAIPNVKFHGVVKSISTATGAALSIIPQDNSAGNFVKVRQRIPVRIDFTENNSPENMDLLRAGMNVECVIKFDPIDYE